MPIRAASCLRVRTTGQTVANQHRELEEAAERDGWIQAAVFEEAGSGGAKGREKRPD